MTAQEHRATSSGSTAILFAAAAAVAAVGCFGHPSTDVATMTCQQDVDCLSGYVCRVKGVPGGCCKPDDLTCGRVQDGATPIDGTRPIADSAMEPWPAVLDVSPANPDGVSRIADVAGDGPSGSGGDASLGTGGGGGSGGSGGSMATDAPGPSGGTSATPDALSPTGGTTSTPDAPVLSDAPDAPTTLPNGSPCTADSQCSNGSCVDGHCCDSKCNGNCESCWTGTCSFSSTPRKACDGSGKCAGYCDKSDTKACTYPDKQTVCAPQSCSGGQRTNKSACDGHGNCPLQTKTTCDNNQCTADGSDCAACTDEPATETCAGGHCGPTTNNCGHTVQCSTTCSGNGQTCGGGGTPNVCGCTDSSACTGHCGTLTNKCGQSVNCPGCTSPSICGGGGTANVCCTPNSSACGSRVCGSVSDGCGGTLACGTMGGNCASGLVCDGSGNCKCSGATLSCGGSYSSCAYWNFEDGKFANWGLDSAACNANPVNQVGVKSSPLGSQALAVVFQQGVCFAVQVCGYGITANVGGLTFHAQAYWATSQTTATYLYIYSNSDINVPAAAVVMAPNTLTNVMASFDSTGPIVTEVGFMVGGANLESGTLYIDNAYFQ